MQEDTQTGSDRAKKIQLWCAYPDDLLAEPVAQACLALLSESERARGQRFRFDKRCREHLATHALQRRALSASFPLAPEAWQFPENAHGKPSAEPECGLRFNVSNSEKLVVCLVGQGAEVGVDVEPRERAAEIAKLAARVFSPAEQAQLEALGDVERLDRALSLWTLKEAYIKARGMGLALPLDGFSFLFGGAEGIRLEIDAALGDDPRRWRFCLLDHAEHRIAVMVEGGPAELHVWEARDVADALLHVHSYGVRWFPRE
jgi:4'-phosphopantetheinyl transferase